MKNIIALLICLFSFMLQGAAQQSISVKPMPEKIWIEKGEQRQYLNFDFLVTNSSSDTFTLTKLAISLYDRSGTLISSRFLDNNGTAPSITLIPNREFAGKISKLIFNPFADHPLTTPLVKLKYEWTFSKNNRQELVIGSEVAPESFVQKAVYNFPLKGRAIVYDGHDLFSHHRRFDYEFSFIKELGLSANFMRYAYDLILLDKQNRQFVGKADVDQDYHGFGKPVYAVAAGKVIYASNEHKDDKQFNIPGIAANPLELYGNCIAIQHADNVVSIYAHLKQNSIRVKKGDMVKGMQEIGAIGVSGSSFLPHLHFEMRSSIAGSAEGIPSYFSNVYLLESGKPVKLRSGLVETGNIIEAK